LRQAPVGRRDRVSVLLPRGTHLFMLGAHLLLIDEAFFKTLAQGGNRSVDACRFCLQARQPVIDVVAHACVL
jgi:hypothetical protein